MVGAGCFEALIFGGALRRNSYPGDKNTREFLWEPY
jgi:hypothetical protein